jgi:hypothetical protein
VKKKIPSYRIPKFAWYPLKDRLGSARKELRESQWALHMGQVLNNLFFLIITAILPVLSNGKNIQDEQTTGKLYISYQKRETEHCCDC